jgi:hypothetical protein
MPHLLLALAFAVLICSPLNAQVAPEADRNKQAVASTRTRQENDFTQLIKQCDDQVFARAEVRRITNFANASANRVTRFFDSVPSGDFAGDLSRRIQSELSRLERIEAAFPSAPDARRPIRAADVRAAQLSLAADTAPPRTNRSPVHLDSFKDAVAAFRAYNHGEMMVELRTSLLDLRQNISQKHMHWAAEFDGFMGSWEQQLRKASGASAIDMLRTLPSVSHETNGSRDQGVLSDEAARVLAAKHRDVLRAASEALKDRPLHANVRTSMLQQIGSFTDRIETVGKNYDNDMQSVERGIVDSAKKTFGQAVGSEILFWLLVVVAGIFVLIMIGPMLYARTTVAENLLKAEFLLQFSTVFILTTAIIILGIGGFIQQDQLPVLLAGISGYVLGQLGKTGADIVRNAPKLEGAAGPSDATPKNDNQPQGQAGPMPPTQRAG